MEVINGIKIQKQDLKKEGQEYLYFKQLASKKNGTTDSTKQNISSQVMEKYESLLINANDEIFGVNGENQVLLDTIPQAYTLAQSMFISG